MGIFKIKGYLLTIGTLIVVISVLITLNVFFQQSLQMEMAEQFSRQQLLLSKFIGDSIKGHITFAREELVEFAQELSERGPVDRAVFDYVIAEELNHRGMVRATLGVLKPDGDVVVVKGDVAMVSPHFKDIARKGRDLKPKMTTTMDTSSMLTLITPIYRNGSVRNIVFFSFAFVDLGTRFFTNIKSGTRGYGYGWMIDKHGNLLYHPTQPGMVGRNLYRADATCFKCHKNFDLEKRIIEGKSEHLGRHIAPLGEDKIIAFSTIEMQNISWVIAVSAPYSEVTQATKRSMGLYSYLIISIFVTTSIVSALLIVSNRKRIKAEEAATRKEYLENYAIELEKRVHERTSELASEKEKLNTIVSAIGGGIVLISKEGKIQWANQMIKDMAGRDLTGSSCEDICPDCRISESYESANIETIILSNLFGQKDRYFQLTTAPVRGENGELHGYIRLIQDVTEIKKMEEQILHSEKLASIGRLAAGIAHEIGNPLTSVFSFVQILREMEEDEFKKESLETIYFHVNRISEILKQLSGFTKMPAGEAKECSANEIIETSLNLIQYDKKAKNISIIKELGADLPDVVVDRNQLSQVFVNLTLNAIDAMPDGGTLTVRSFAKDNALTVQFEDTGTGISKDDVKKIFDPFFTTKEKGTGLGLAVSYNIIKKMNGTLTVDSEVGKGTIFSITIPTKEEQK